MGGAYVRLLDGSNEFTAEVVTSATGQFRFFAAPGSWTAARPGARRPRRDGRERAAGRDHRGCRLGRLTFLSSEGAVPHAGCGAFGVSGPDGWLRRTAEPSVVSLALCLVSRPVDKGSSAKEGEAHDDLEPRAHES